MKKNHKSFITMIETDSQEQSKLYAIYSILDKSMKKFRELYRRFEQHNQPIGLISRPRKFHATTAGFSTFSKVYSVLTNIDHILGQKTVSVNFKEFMLQEASSDMMY